MKVTYTNDIIKKYYGDQVALRCSETPIGEAYTTYISSLHIEFFARRTDEDKYEVQAIQKENGIAGIGF